MKLEKKMRVIKSRETKANFGKYRNQKCVGGGASQQTKQLRKTNDLHPSLFSLLIPTNKKRNKQPSTHLLLHLFVLCIGDGHY